MCATCGCGNDSGITIEVPGQGHVHLHSHGDGHWHTHEGHTHEHSPTLADRHHEHDHGNSQLLQLEADILHGNTLLAERNRGYFEALSVYAINLVSSPGSGKTTLLESTIRDLSGKLDIAVIEGDQQTSNDAARIAKHKVSVIQINTGKMCHLDAGMVGTAAKSLLMKPHSILFIENVGNLVCPAMFDLGENSRVVVMSVTEGDDKAIKYPEMFRTSSLCLINKTDLLPYVEFDVTKAMDLARRVNPKMQFIEMSATTGEGLGDWYNWLQEARIT